MVRIEAHVTEDVGVGRDWPELENVIRVILGFGLAKGTPDSFDTYFTGLFYLKAISLFARRSGVLAKFLSECARGTLCIDDEAQIVDTAENGLRANVLLR